VTSIIAYMLTHNALLFIIIIVIHFRLSLTVISFTFTFTLTLGSQLALGKAES